MDDCQSGELAFPSRHLLPDTTKLCADILMIDFILLLRAVNLVRVHPTTIFQRGVGVVL
jgi:hypothetical protein